MAKVEMPNIGAKLQLLWLVLVLSFKISLHKSDSFSIWFPLKCLQIPLGLPWLRTVCTSCCVLEPYAASSALFRLWEIMWRALNSMQPFHCHCAPLTAQSLLSMTSESAHSSAPVTGTLLFPNTEVSVAAPFWDPIPWIWAWSYLTRPPSEWSQTSVPMDESPVFNAKYFCLPSPWPHACCQSPLTPSGPALDINFLHDSDSLFPSLKIEGIWVYW